LAVATCCRNDIIEFLLSPLPELNRSTYVLGRRCKEEFIAVGNRILTGRLCPLALGLFVIYIDRSIFLGHKGYPTLTETGKLRRCGKPDLKWF
jgi:hypothetical protein